MSWSTTTAAEEFLSEAGEFLRAEPARNSVVLTVTENLRVKAVTAPSAATTPLGTSPGPDRTLLGWWRPDVGSDLVGGAFLHTPEFPVFLTAMSRQAAAELAAELAAAGRLVLGVNAEQETAEAFAAAWRQRTGGDAQVHRRMRLFRLGELIPLDPRPEGSARPAAEPDRDLLIAWFGAFAREVGDLADEDHAAAVDERLSYGGIIVWEAGGAPVSIAGLTRAVAGMVRVGPVYTPPELRGRGYAGAATVAVSQAARDAGAQGVVLYTDLANPTSNALYQRLGYRPVEDRIVLSYEPAESTLLARESTPAHHHDGPSAWFAPGKASPG
jgi:RimJ/RimL family protein N-acetyltransferase